MKPLKNEGTAGPAPGALPDCCVISGPDVVCVKSVQYPAPGSIAPSGNDCCVICGADSGVPSTTPVSDRYGYVEGSGQTCSAHAHEFGA